MTDRNVACKNCGTKVFKSPEEADDHHKDAHPEVENQGNAKNQDQKDQDQGDQ